MLTAAQFRALEGGSGEGSVAGTPYLSFIDLYALSSGPSDAPDTRVMDDEGIVVTRVQERKDLWPLTGDEPGIRAR